MSFADRVAYQRAIENVYWQHRIWPRDRGERPDPKPSLDAVMSQAELEKKVTEYLRNSQTLEDHWQRPITADQLQAEMDRMAEHSRQPEVLRELFAALGNDPFVIAECLARPVLAERLVTNSYAHDQEALESWSVTRAGARSRKRRPQRLLTICYRQYRVSRANAMIAGRPPARPTHPLARVIHTAVWTGSEMIVWGGGVARGCL